MSNTNCVEDIRNELKKTNIEENRSSLLQEIKNCWKREYPEREIFRLINEILLDEKESEKVKITAIGILKEIGFIVFDLEYDYDEFDTETAITLNKLLKLNKSVNNCDLVASIFTLLENYSKEILKVLDEKVADPRITENPNYYIEIMESILEDTLEIPALVDKLNVIKNSLEFWSRYLHYVDYWQVKFPYFQYNVTDLWDNIEDKVLSYIENTDEKFKEIRKRSALLIQQYGKHKGEAILQKAILNEKYTHVKIELIKALTEIALLEESHFVFLNVMKKGKQIEKEEASNSLIKFANKLGYNNGNELIEKHKPTTYKPLDYISLLGSILAVIINIGTISGLMIEYNSVNAWTISLIIISTIIIFLIIGFVILTPICQKKKYEKMEKKWGIT